MRAFIVLSLVAVACAQQGGYNYQQASSTDSGFAVLPGGTFGDATNSIPSFAVPESAGPGSQGLGGPGLSGSPSYDSQGSNVPPSYAPLGVADQDTNGTPTYAPQGELEKEFYTYSANDEDFHNPAATNQIVSAVKRGLRVVFIKGPDNRALEDAAINLAKQAADQKTDIYVLNKQADLADLANRLNNENKNNNNKPEVHFVKYRTPEDAANAQKAIQSQYDQLGGPSKQIDGGVAPALNFASQGPVRGPSGTAPRNNYLPASVFRY